MENLVKKNSNYTLNASTLKRIWGYSKTESKPRRTTLTILAKILGNRDWEGYVERKRKENRTESGFIRNTIVNISELQPGDTVSMKWNPNRSMTLRYLGCEKFEVFEQENSSLRVGDTFRSLAIRDGYPIYCKDVVRNNENLGDYIAGEENGIFSLHLHPVANC
ncbi:MAG: hypothetical protein K2H86_04080 [Muribaculaceae bacterium]|nr:hypothetical protein [Muribaculaceae bacterium]